MMRLLPAWVAYPVMPVRAGDCTDCGVHAGSISSGKRYLSEATCRLFTTETSAISRRGLGFDKPNLKDLKNSPCAASATAAVYGHTGFTGTCAWVDPEHGTVYVFLSNRLCPNVWNTKLGEMNIRTDIQEAIYKSLK